MCTLSLPYSLLIHLVCGSKGQQQLSFLETKLFSICFPPVFTVSNMEKIKHFAESTFIFALKAPCCYNMHSRYCPPYTLLHLCTVNQCAITPSSWKGRAGFYQSRVPLHLHVYRKKKGITRFYWMQFYVFISTEWCVSQQRNELYRLFMQL